MVLVDVWAAPFAASVSVFLERARMNLTTVGHRESTDFFRRAVSGITTQLT